MSMKSVYLTNNKIITLSAFARQAWRILSSWFVQPWAWRESLEFSWIGKPIVYVYSLLFMVKCQLGVFILPSGWSQEGQASLLSTKCSCLSKKTPRYTLNFYLDDLWLTNSDVWGSYSSYEIHKKCFTYSKDGYGFFQSTYIYKVPVSFWFWMFLVVEFFFSEVFFSVAILLSALLLSVSPSCGPSSHTPSWSYWNSDFLKWLYCFKALHGIRAIVFKKVWGIPQAVYEWLCQGGRMEAIAETWILTW